MYIPLLLGDIFYKSQLDPTVWWFVQVFCSLSDLCLLVLSIAESEMLKSSIIEYFSPSYPTIHFSFWNLIPWVAQAE